VLLQGTSIVKGIFAKGKSLTYIETAKIQIDQSPLLFLVVFAADTKLFAAALLLCFLATHLCSVNVQNVENTNKKKNIKKLYTVIPLSA